MDQPIILIADDDSSLRELYVRKLTHAGFAPVAFPDGGQALDCAKQQPPALMFCDIHMEPIGGFEVLQRLPRTERSFPIVMLTNFADPEVREQALALGADGYLVKKDMTLQTLVEMAKRFLKDGRKGSLSERRAVP